MSVCMHCNNEIETCKLSFKNFHHFAFGRLTWPGYMPFGGVSRVFAECHK